MIHPTIAFGADHAGKDLKDFLINVAKSLDYTVIDLGTNTLDSVDYPDYANAVADHILKKKAALGVLICGTGIGMSMAANRHQGIRAALCHCSLEASLARRHNNANILCLGGRILGPSLAGDCLKSFLSSEFEGERHQTRIDKFC